MMSLMLVAAAAAAPGSVFDDMRCAPIDPDGSSLAWVVLNRKTGGAAIHFAGRIAEGRMTAIQEGYPDGIVYNMKFPWEWPKGNLGPGGELEVVIHRMRGVDGNDASYFMAAATLVRNGKRHLESTIPLTFIKC